MLITKIMPNIFISIIDGEMFENNERPTTSRPIVLSPDSVILSEDTEHVYAVLEQTHLQQPTTIVIQRNETVLTEEAQQTHEILLETVPSNEFQHVTNQTVGLESRSATWGSAQQLKFRPKPRHESLELVQIYDNVVAEPKVRAVARDMDNKSLYPGNYRKHSLPVNVGEHQNSTVIETDASQDFPASNEPDEKTDESIPIYSKPDMSKKREERRRKRELKEQEGRTMALQKVSLSSSPPPLEVTELEREPQKSDDEISIERGSGPGVVIDGQQQTDSDNNHLEFGKQLQICEKSNNPDNKVPQGNNECLYDTPTSLDLIPKRTQSQNINRRKEKEDDDGEEES
jgi:hypothetical protein